MICFRLLDSKDPAQPLADAVRALANEEINSNTYVAEPTLFRHIPNAPFAYLLSPRLLNTFPKMQPFETESRVAKRGVNSNDDFRFLRLTWEVFDEEWVLHVKGGEFARYYSNPTMKVKWGLNELLADRVTSNKYKYAIVPSKLLYFRPGFTWSLRTQSGLSTRVLPQGCIFGSKGPAGITKNDSHEDILSLVAITNSPIFLALVEVQTAFGSYEVGVIQRTPIPEIEKKENSHLAILARNAWQNKRKPDTANLTSHAFISPALAPRSKHI